MAKEWKPPKFTRKQYARHVSGPGGKFGGKTRITKKHHRATNDIGSDRIPPGIRRNWRKKK